MLSSRKGWSFTILLYYFKTFSKSWSQRQKVGVKYSKFGVNENSGSMLCLMQVIFGQFLTVLVLDRGQNFVYAQYLMN